MQYYLKYFRFALVKPIYLDMLCDKLCTFNCMCVSDTVNCSLIVGSNTEDYFIRFETCVRNLCDDICAINCGWFYKLYFFF